ncbi:MAG: GyrI-like domain-containing protein [Pseudobdellovibrio sp.]
MIKHTLYAIALGFILFFLYLLQYTGAFKSVTISQDKRGPYTLISKNHLGAYHQIVTTIEEVEKWAQANGLKCRLSFGEYFDDPNIVEEGRLTSRGGCLIDPLVPEEAETLKKLEDHLPADFKVDTFPETNAVVALFTGAPSIGPMKVYPAALDYIAENRLTKKGSVLEIYEVFNQKAMQTTYIWPLQN